ncbi:GNAT family N-acetyltransferase [Catenovulum sp. 2E275]|uniref:GNAT family N-acetyltransferase n=1 Tax=Catenovulum sp. 2E275 TaxID=2980497 RepID=UPI0021CE89B2|nr:GNAT family N-acetyltransferase [Catenovulum sp. 2E275]MCU4677066.1 GNAT family N-acetyltransferase [Catenovulum sp. 2E275]
MLNIKQIQLEDEIQAAALLNLLKNYALDPMGGGEALSPYSQQNLIAQLKLRNDYIGWLAYWQQQPVGLLNAFEGFSTFYAKPLLNIHDLTVAKSFRGKGIANQLMQTAEHYARTNHFCKLTLEVLTENAVARNLYVKQGYQAYQLAENAGVAQFWQKEL